jgi:hypothetical protein
MLPPVNCHEAGCGPIPGQANHCATCHQTFGGLGDFDRHHPIGQACRPPAELGLVLDARGVWVTEAGRAARAASRERMTAMRRGTRAGMAP